MNHPSTYFRIPLFALALFLLVLSACSTSTPPHAVPLDETPVELPPSPALLDDVLPGDSLPGATILPPDLPDAPAPALAPLSRLYILRWNPAISSFTDATFREGFARLLTEGDARTNWSIHDWSSVRPGDWALFVRVGGGTTDGIAGLCRFLSPAYEGASWRGDGSTDHYADIDILLLNDPARSGLFAAGELDAVFPGIDWHGGHSGILLAPELAESVALHIADRLARLDDASLPPNALAAAPLADDASRAIACALLSRLCPDFKQALASRIPPILPVWAEPWLPEPGIDILYAPARLSPGQTLLDAARLFDPAVVADATPSFTPDDAAFAADLLRTAAEPGQNAIVSPLGADTLLAALALGTRGPAADALLDFFGGDTALSDCTDRVQLNHFVCERNHALLRIARSPELFDRPPLPQYAADADAPADASPVLETLDILWVRDGPGIDKAYASLCRELLNVDLLAAPSITDGADLPGPPENPLLARNHLAFRARWQTPFAPADTLPSVFHSPSGDLRVPFMNRFGNITVKKLPGTRWTAFTLPYAGCDLELLMLLPPRDATPQDLQDGLADVLAAEWTAPSASTPAFLTMPRFTFGDTTTQLAPILDDLGAGTLRDPATADLAGITSTPKTYLHALVQQLPFSVTESGTAPFSVPPPVHDEVAQPAPNPFRILLNRPFAFALRDNRTGLLLLLGQIFTPDTQE